jgi:Zn-dependent metalloprotease
MLREIAKRGEEDEREHAFKSLSLSGQFRGRREVLGAFMLASATPTGEKRRTIYDAKHGEDLPGMLVRGEGDPKSKDPAVNEAYDGAGITYELYKMTLDRNSIDNRGLRLDSTVHYGRDYDNAFWEGRQMVYGDGDGKLFNRFTKAIDVIGHELAHGVMQYEAALVYKDQSGALNESFSDVFGSLVKQYKLKQKADKADWLIGKGLFAPKVKGVALRSMKEPGTAYDDPVLGKDPQPGHMKDYQKTEDDNGGVHLNSGIPNHAFYFVAMELGGHAWEKAGRIWYVTLRDRLRSKANFQQMADLTFRVAGELYGKASREQKAVRAGWKGVGITVKAS